jgi:heme exporter protein C
MKALILSLGFIIGIGWGLYPGLLKPRPLWMRLGLIAIMTIMVIMALFPRIAGTPEDVALIYRMGMQKSIPVLCTIDVTKAEKQASGEWMIPILGKEQTFLLRLTADVLNPADFGNGKPIIAEMKRGNTDAELRLSHIVQVDPLITLPYIVGLEERARILYFHVPMSWIAFLAYIISMIMSIRYLRNPSPRLDIIASSSAALGTLFCILATVSGAIWAKFNWGSFWNWDPRETSIFVLLLIYGAYFVLRSAIEQEQTRARLSSVYSIIGAIAAVFFIYVAPRIYGGLHPGSADDSNAGPVLSQQAGTLDILKQIILSMAFCAFTMLYFWLLGLASRIRLASRDLQSIMLQKEQQS